MSVRGPSYSTTGEAQTGMMDLTGQNATISIFGETVTAARIATNASQFVYGVDTRDAIAEGTGSGSAVVEDDNMLVIRTGTTAGSSFKIETKDPLQYIPGYEANIFFTLVLSRPVEADGYSRGGIFDDTDGVFLALTADNLRVVRKRAGVTFETTRENFNMDKLDGTGPSKIDLDLDDMQGNVFSIRYGFLGFAPIVFCIMNAEGTVYPFHKIRYPNTATVTHMANTYLPARIEVYNGAAGTDDVYAKVGSFNMGVINGNQETITNRRFSLGTVGVIASSAGGHVRTPIIVFRNKATFQGPFLPSARENRIGAILEFLYLLISGQNKELLIELIIIDSSQEVGGATFTDKASTSVLQYSTDAVLDYGTYVGGDVIFSFGLQKTDDTFERELFRYLFNLRPGQDAVFALTSATTLALDYVFTNLWREKF